MMCRVNEKEFENSKGITVYFDDEMSVYEIHQADLKDDVVDTVYDGDFLDEEYQVDYARLYAEIKRIIDEY